MRKLCADIKDRKYIENILIIDKDLTFPERVTEKLTSINKLLHNTSTFPEE